ncbi:MAG TPA: NAD(P)H-dependent glycerol-3-phosphate dehydrogenase [Fimbriimonadaceae bacterium]|nr:glycerol-3-phosphate dehydrogenase [Armatimonadota bacterium]HRI73453.1 NAD(P)H-dependent glycerol-3-phosphate dehydrogenase [Fimbriimonadaceae bacterium]
MQVHVVGAGSWGTALTLVLARNGLDVRIIGRDEDTLASLRACRENLRYLPGFLLPKDVEVGSWDDLAEPAEMTVIAVPTAAVSEVLDDLKSPGRIVIASKGLTNQGDGLLTDLLEEKCPGVEVAALSGPNLALELARGIPTVAVAASTNATTAERVRDAFMSRTYRVYVSDDIRGVELAGALKNVLAIGAGMGDGLGFGDNTKGALLARGLNEMARLGMKMGARLDTFMGIAGVGDLFATASSKLSRNYRVGYALGQGRSLNAALEEVGQVAEGVPTSEQARRLALKYEVPMPVHEVLWRVITGEYEARAAVQALMERTPTREGVTPS